jgi:hypothetical protein
MNLSLLKTRWHLGRRASKNVNKHVPWAPDLVPSPRKLENRSADLIKSCNESLGGGLAPKSLERIKRKKGGDEESSLENENLNGSQVRRGGKCRRAFYQTLEFGFYCDVFFLF